MTSVDQLDVAIIGRLGEDARVGIAELATVLGVSRHTVQQRLKRLMDEGILRGFIPDVALDRIGLPVQARVSLELDQRKLSSVARALGELPNVLEVKTQAGREDLVATVAGASLQEIQDVAESIVNIDGVRHTTTTLTVSTPVPFDTQRLLEHVFRSSGWGRSTPAP